MRGLLGSLWIGSILALASAFCPVPTLRAAYRPAGCAQLRMVWQSNKIKLMKDNPIHTRGKSAEPPSAPEDDSTMTTLLLNLRNDWETLEEAMGGMEAGLGEAKGMMAIIGEAQQKELKHFGSIQTRVAQAESLLAWQRKEVHKLKGLISEIPENLASLPHGGQRTHAENAWMRGRDGELKKVQEAHEDIKHEVEALRAWANFFKNGGTQPAN